MVSLLIFLIMFSFVILICKWMEFKKKVLMGFRRRESLKNELGIVS